MKNYYSISIPKPCHENWDTMTQREKGRFCNSCNKTVIDFTKMRTYEIQDFINENKSTNICGHFKQTQLDSINLHIPSHLLSKQHSFHKLFLLALMIAMGPSLFSCTNRNGNKQKIDSIEVVDSISKSVISIPESLEQITETDSTSKKPSSEKIMLPEILTDGELVIETLGDVAFIEKMPLEIDSIKVIQLNELEDEIELLGDMETKDEIVLGLINVEAPPEFLNTPTHLDKKGKQDFFSKKVSEFILENFKTPQGYQSFNEIQRLNAQFKIDRFGVVRDIQVHSSHQWLKKEAIRTLLLLPEFKPAEHNGKPVDMVYSLPIIFQVEEE